MKQSSLADKARWHRYRERRRTLGIKRKLPTKFDRGRFVAVDGEGFSDGAPVRVEVGNPPRAYDSHEHYYALLADSDGNEIWAPEGRLAAKQCLDFLLDIGIRDPDAVPVIFGGSYDVCHMLAFDLARGEVRELLQAGGGIGRRRVLDISLSHGGHCHDYRLEYRPRKQLTIWRFAPGADKYRKHVRRDGTSEWKLDAECRVTLWDVWGFFQCGFTKAMSTWIPDDPDWQFINRMKGERNIFERSEIDTIRKYTAAELRALVTIMERVREAMVKLDLKLKRWDGAGAIAKAMFARENVKEHMGACPAEVFEAARVAYSGGHIEATVIGHHAGPVWHYDVNSAYPHQFRRLPSLSAGHWQSGEGGPPPEGFTLVQVQFHFLPGLPFYPLFWRAGGGAILYPERGSGWYWWDEYDAAREFAERFGAFTFRVVAWHHFETRRNTSPFGWIETAYQVRRDVIMRARETGIRDDSHLMIRLGLNSCYGATAQQVGARWQDGAVVPPAYFQLEWAGAVTAGCRAQLMRAAMQKPRAVISFATDAIFATEPLDLPCDPVKRLGEWEAHEHEGMTIVMPGVYWLHEAGGRLDHFSRGFDKQSMKDCQFVHDAWKRGQSSVAVMQRRMITLGAGMMSENLWQLRGMFVTTTRELAINGLNSKRYPVAMTQVRPHKGLVRTRPREHTEDVGQELASLMSATYPIAWLNPDAAPDAQVEDDYESPFLLDPDTMQSAFLV
jgi:hypothetical protein